MKDLPSVACRGRQTVWTSC